MRVALYIRVSTLEQVEGYSISEQTERLKKFCEAKDWTIVFTYVDPGYSGGSLHRPAISQMIDDIKRGGIDIVLVYKLDRLSRSQKDTLYLIEDIFLNNNVNFVSMSESFDTTTPLGKAMIGILSVFAQLERDQIKERMAMGNVGRAKDGYWRGGSGVPIGYDYKDGKLAINEYEAMQIREIFDLFIKGNTLHGIRDILSSKYSNKYSSWNNAGVIGKILKNTTYIGKLRYKGEEYKGQHDAIIDDDVFHAAQLRYSEIEKDFNEAQKSPFKGKHLLSGMIFCGNCGARYFTHCTMSKKAGTYYYYICYSRDGNREMKKIDSCKNPNYREDILDDMIISEILRFADNPCEIDELRKKHEAKPDNKNAVIKNRLIEIEKQISKLMDLYQLGTISFSDISDRIDPLHDERAHLESELSSILNKEPLITAEQAKELIFTAKEIFASDSLDDKRTLVNALIRKITIMGNGFKIHWKFTL